MQQNLTLFAYFNIDIPMVAWEVAVGRVKSACDGGSGYELSLWQFHHLKILSEKGESPHVVDEFRLEGFRQMYMPEKVSRFKGIYLFDSKEMACIALDRWGLSHHKKYISPVNFSANKISRYDSEWITAYKGKGGEHWFRPYFSGETLGAAPLVEVLASGIGVVVSQELRIEAYKRVLGMWPNSTPLLYCAICAFGEARVEDAALVRPFLTNNGSGIRGEFFIFMESMRLRQVEIAKAVRVCERRGLHLPVISPDDSDAIFALPDFSDEEFLIKISDAQKEFCAIYCVQ
jgi:hypothetical protein